MKLTSNWLRAFALVGVLSLGGCITVGAALTVAQAVAAIVAKTSADPNAGGCSLIPVAADLYLLFQKDPGAIQNWASIAATLCNSVIGDGKFFARRGGQGSVTINGTKVRFKIKR